jgi:DNA ligase-1
MITKPMLAGKCTNKDNIKYPVLATPKLDGIRCLVINGHVVSRTFKPIPNKFIREEIERLFPDGVDGEIMIPKSTFGDITGAVMSSKNAQPCGFEYWVFDYVSDGDINTPYFVRMERLKNIQDNPRIHKLIPITINNRTELDKFEEKCLDEGFEGVIIRSPNGPYKCGRSTEKEGYLLKIKQFEDSEAKIISFEEKMHNENEAGVDAFGRTERSLCREGMKPAGTLGKIVVIDLTSGLTFSIGSGFDDKTRQEIWNNQSSYLGKIVKYKFQPYGVKELPRFPIFIGFRHTEDIS